MADKAIIRESSDGALCQGLKDPIDDLSRELVKQQENTPDEVIIKGTRVIKGYDEGCK